MDKKSLNCYINKIYSVFVRDYDEISKKISAKNRKDLLPYTVNMYQKWFNSASIEDSVFSWANLCESYMLENGIKETVIPLAVPKSFNRSEGFKLKINIYGENDMPIVNDFFVVLDYFEQQIMLEYEIFIKNEDFINIAPKISIPDKFYVAYILEIAYQIGALDEIPSIYTKVLIKREGLEDIRKEPQNIIFDKIFEAALSVASDRICEMLGCEVADINSDIIKRWLSKPLPVDDIFKEIYFKFDINIEEIWSIDIKEADEVERYILSTTYLLGIVIDRWILTPFAYYFGMIQPLYTLRYRFEDEMTYFYTALNAYDGDIEGAVFSPCTKYFLTHFGAKYLGGKFDESKKEAFEGIPLEGAINIFDEQNKLVVTENRDIKVYHIRVRFSDERLFWLVFEVNAEMTLDQLHRMICDKFMFDSSVKYSFFMDKDFNPFVEYVSKNMNSINSKKTWRTRLEDLNFVVGQKLYYRCLSQEFGFSEQEEAVVLELEILKKLTVNESDFYPRVVRRSKFAKELQEF